ncbi:Peptidoglycan/LPS O-acetylase OafA/YrhL, contains acyltransferase and SGNH-hydrolase domains [Algoriella xinjiangensis]|uniref:Peptidoglycan/LPS O-acetylase OafA/YrhL, contains acyltransferase and SGNH-hydrolase domains n=1 Tax=Algoriella xinjiangensis TaxID=684065 RepID=A0A1I4V0C6_9FLAO|nr:acyltransferase [Algoriella xinjiangensis]SFM94729.1 Peptidoglycan/LPS O-acetylase OafA/YrhL, contains acyltransferase and SGNH-hydrolase domains [Algoriella xinjiangensis]VDH18063.1 Uncharacterized protein conserved in bacteria [Algoriella xinjiangensis]
MNSRISILDGLRVFAILIVMISHYLNCYNLDGNPILQIIAKYGYFGVPFFFIISGFVILYSLGNTKTYTEFLKKRYIRLAPAMFICSLITFCFFYFIYTGPDFVNSKSFANLLIANTFIDPHIFNLPSGTLKYYYIDGSYWSLWVEVCFYLMIGFLYYRNKKTYIRDFVIICVIFFPIYFILSSDTAHHILQKQFNLKKETLDYFHLLSRCFVIFRESFWFMIGMFLYKLYNNKSDKKYIVFIIICALILVLQEKLDLGVVLLTIFTLITYFTFIYNPKYLNFLTNPIITKIGVSSYSIYLIHSYLGMGIIKMYNKYVGHESFVIYFLVIFIVLLFGLFSYRYLEKPLSNLLKKLLFK